jgi:hypothetical protein
MNENDTGALSRYSSYEEYEKATYPKSKDNRVYDMPPEEFGRKVASDVVSAYKKDIQEAIEKGVAKNGSKVD